MAYRFQRHASLSFTLLKFYAQARAFKKMQERKAFVDRENKIKNLALIKMTGVGMYWAQIKGRFRGSKSSAAERRIYLAMKYGNIWRAKAQIKKFNH